MPYIIKKNTRGQNIDFLFLCFYNIINYILQSGAL